MSVWYEWPVAIAGTWEVKVTADSSAAMPTVYELVEGEGLVKITQGAFQETYWDQPTSPTRTLGSRSARFRIEEGRSIFIQVVKKGTLSTDFELALAEIEKQPEGDLFSSAPMISGVGKFDVEMKGALNDEREPPSLYDASVWRRWTVPTTGFWKVGGVDGSVTRHRMVASVDLGDRGFGDVRLPELTRIQVSPISLDLLSGPAEVMVDLAANDDRAGLMAEIRVMDSESRVLALQEVSCELPSMDCTVAMQLPRLTMRGVNAAARVEVTLRDGAGREVVYGRPDGVGWPGGFAPSLALFDEESDHFSHWKNLWLGQAGDGEDRDGDGWSDVMEYAFGSDPGVRIENDPLGSRMPESFIIYPVHGLQGVQRRLELKFQLAPWFEWSGGRFLSEDFEFVPESSTDLLSWEETRRSFLESNSRAVSAWSSVPGRTRGNWIRVRVRERDE